LPDLPAVGLGDKLRLRQILLNLVSNALTITALGSVQLAATCEGHKEAQAIYSFSVIDTGPGISADNLSVLKRFLDKRDRTRRPDLAALALGFTSRGT
jgi:signal transduction histidine kinase